MIEHFNFEQNSPEWDELRRGIVTSSEMSTVLAKGKTKGEPSVGRRRYMMRLAAERLGAAPSDRYTNTHMERGHLLEDEARRLYSFLADEEPVRVGFIINRELNCGTSPDALVGSRGALEIKTKLPHLQIEVLIANKIPSEHIPQVQGQVMVGDLDFVDFVSYWPGLPLFRKRIGRDEAYIKTLAAEVARFNADLAEMVETVRRYGEPSSLRAALEASVA